MPLQRPDPIPISEPEPVFRRIAWHIENAFIRIFKRVFNAVKDSMQDLLAFAIREFADDIESGLRVDMGPMLDELQSYDDLPSWIRQTISNARTSDNAAAVLILGAIVVALGQVLARGASEAISPMVTHRLNAIFKAQITDPYTAIELLRRGIITRDDLLKLTRANGYPDWLTDMLVQLSTRITPESMLLPAYWRKIVSEGTVDDVLSKSGYRESDITLWKQLSERIPSPAELVSIAVREGFDDAVARQFGYDEAYPTEAAEAAEKGGMPQEWFRRLWRAHWRLPSVTQGFDMYHRGIMSKAELELLLRASDIPSFWREKLIRLSYNVITRVDIRRMYALGVLTDQQVYEKYLDYGYSPDDAQSLTEWTIKEYAEEDRTLTKTDVLRMYRDSVLNESEASAYLGALGYGTEEIGLLLVREDLQRNEQYEKEVVKNVRLGYLAGTFDRSDVYGQLGKLDPPADFIRDRLEIWELERRRRIVRPTVTQLRDFWKTGIINDRQLEEQLQARGYTETYIQWYKDLWSEA